jgi:replication factor C subunit 1
MKAGFDIDLPALEKLCESCHSDIRLVINTLQFWSTETNSMTFQEVKKSLDGQLKDVETSPFEVVGSFFERIGNSKNWFNERIDHYFVDMSLVPLMVQEKFAVCSSDAKGLDIVQKIAEAAESISQADLLDNQLRSTASFSLLPLHAALSCVIPGAYVSGFGGRGPPTFPSWLGKNSTRRKNIRLFTEMKVHMSRICTGNAASVQLDYCPVLRSQLLSTLASNEHDSIEKTIEMLDTYGLDLEDFETIQISPFSSQQAQKIETKVKTQLTKAFKKLHDFEAGRRKRKDDSGGDMGLAEENDDMIYDAGGADDEEEGNSENETEIEAAKPKSVKSKGSKTTAAKSSKSKPSSSSSSSKKPVSSKKLK